MGPLKYELSWEGAFIEETVCIDLLKCLIRISCRHSPELSFIMKVIFGNGFEVPIQHYPA